MYELILNEQSVYTYTQTTTHKIGAKYQNIQKYRNLENLEHRKKHQMKGNHPHQRQQNHPHWMKVRNTLHHKQQESMVRQKQ